MLSVAIVWLVAAEPIGANVSLWMTGRPCAEVMDAVSRQTGTPIVCDENLGKIPLSVYCTAISTERLFAALEQVLDADIAAKSDTVYVRRNEGVWRDREALHSQFRQAFIEALTRARQEWIALGVLADEEQALAQMEERSRARMRERYRNRTVTLDDLTLDSLVEHNWPFSYIAAGMTDAEFAEFLKGEPALASSKPVPGVPLVTPIESQHRPLPVSWVYWLAPDAYRLSSVSHYPNYQSGFFPMSNVAEGHTHVELDMRDEPYCLHIKRQMEKFEEARLDELERNAAVRSNMDDPFTDTFHQAIALTGRPVVAEHVGWGSYRGNPDLAVKVEGVLAIKPRFHWRRNYDRPSVAANLSPSNFGNNIALFDAATRIVLERDDSVWLGEVSGLRNEISMGDYPSGGRSFGQLWTSLSQQQKADLLGQGLAADSLGPGQFDLFRRWVYRSFYNSSSLEFPLEHLAPAKLKACRVRIEAEPAIAQKWALRSDGTSMGTHMLPLKYVKWIVEDGDKVTTEVSVGCLYQFKVFSGSTLVFDNHGSLWAPLTRGQPSTIRRDLEAFRRKHG